MLATDRYASNRGEPSTIAVPRAARAAAARRSQDTDWSEVALLRLARAVHSWPGYATPQ